MSAEPALTTPHGFGQVVLVTGHMTDGPTRSASRFPETAVPAVGERIEAALRGWNFGSGDLLICGGARGGDLIAAGVAERLGATVWLLLAEAPDEFERNSVAGGAEHWIDAFRTLVERVPTLVLAERPDGDHDRVYVAANEWMLDIATAQADGGPLRLLAVWDGSQAEGPGGTAEMVAAARRDGADVTVIDPGG
jgi:hypothetical protein